jgi:Alpha-2,8-polysialyltransferase (POLYST)
MRTAIVDGDTYWGDVAVVPPANINCNRWFPQVIAECVGLGLRVVLLERLGSEGYIEGDTFQTARAATLNLPGASIRTLDLLDTVGGPATFRMIREYAMIRRMMPSAPFLCLLTHKDSGGLIKMLIYWCKSKGIPTVVVQEGISYRLKAGSHPKMFIREAGIRRMPRVLMHGIISRLPFELTKRSPLYSYSDYVCCYGPRMKEALTDMGRSPESIFVVGCPALDDQRGVPEIKPVSGRRVLFAQQSFGRMEREMSFYRQLAMECVDLLEYRLIFKTHPRGGISGPVLEKELRRAIQNQEKLTIVAEGDVNDMMDEADVFITCHSTSIYHALIRRIPVITVSFLDEYATFDRNGLDAIREVSTPGELVNALKCAMEDESVRQRYARGAERAIEQHLFKLDGNASKRVAEVVAHLVRRNGTARECGGSYS